jgi:single-strand DNA-binding protein
MNRVFLLGRVGNDPETKVLTDATVTSFSLATSKKWKKNGEAKEQTEWHKIVAWDKLSDVISKYVTKGSKLLIEGEIRYRNYENKDGQKVYITEIYCLNMEMMDSRKQEETKPEPSGTNTDFQKLNTSTGKKTEEPEDDGLPF